MVAGTGIKIHHAIAIAMDCHCNHSIVITTPTTIMSCSPLTNIYELIHHRKM
jgi:hypothetical protein